MKITLSKELFTSPLILSTTSLLLLLPFFFSFFIFTHQNEKIKAFEERVLFVQKQTLKKEAQIKKEEKILSQIAHSTPSYLEDCLHSMSFLATERQKWKIFISQVEPSQSMKERSIFLENGANRLEFIEGETQKNGIFVEQEVKQKSPVEINEEDLKSLLCSIEGVKIHPYEPKEGAPQILIKSFEMEKKSVEDTKEKNYSVQMQLIKRQGI